MIARHGVGAMQARADDVVDADRAQMDRLHRPGGIAGREPFDEAIQPVRLLVDHLEELASALAGELRGLTPDAHTDQRRDRGLDGRERCPQIVRQRVEQRRFELLVPARRLRLARALECALQFLIQPLDLVPPGVSLGGAPLRPRRELAGNHRRDDEGDEGNPVLRVLDPEPGGREDVIRVGRGPRGRRDQGGAGPPQSRHDDDVEQQERGGDTGVADRRQAEHGDNRSDGEGRPDVFQPTHHPIIGPA